MSYDLTPAELPAFEAWLAGVTWPYAEHRLNVKIWREQLAWQAGPAAVDTTGDMFGIPAELAAAARASRTGLRGPSGYPDFFTLEA